ncbi:MAG: hypothetical protein ACRCWI_07460 [Brevinema sp.]
MNKHYHLLFLTVFVMSNTLLFAQNFFSEQTTENLKPEYSAKKDKHKKENPSFSFSIPKQNQSHMKVFDTHAIFDFEEEISIALTNTKELQSEFRKEMRLIDIQINYLKNELMGLLEGHQKGTNNASQMVDTYSQLYQLCDKRYSTLDEHTKAMQDILSTTYEKYHNKIQEKLSIAKEDPDMIVTELLDRYAAFQK